MMIYGLACLLFGEARTEAAMIAIGSRCLAAWRWIRRSA